MSTDLSGRIALVTGGDSGIGAACAQALAEAGADVAILYHSSEEDAAKTCRAVESRGRRGGIVQADVGKEEEVEWAFDAIAEALGVPDILVNSAGLNMSDTAVADLSVEQWERVLATDVTGSFLACRRFVRDRRGKGGPAAIVNITSIHDEAMRAGGADYGAAKGAQRNLTRTLAIELAGDGITVNAIVPLAASRASSAATIGGTATGSHIAGFWKAPRKCSSPASATVPMMPAAHSPQARGRRRPAPPACDPPPR